VQCVCSLLPICVHTTIHGLNAEEKFVFLKVQKTLKGKVLAFLFQSKDSRLTQFKITFVTVT